MKVSPISLLVFSIIAIMLSRFKHTFAELKQGILNMDENMLDYEKASKLMEYVPTKEEIDLISECPEERYTLNSKVLIIFMLLMLEQIKLRKG